MSLGAIIRKILGPGLFPAVGRWYRSLFIDLEKTVEYFPDLSKHSHVLDIGGGDGEIINHLLLRYPHLKVTIIDIAPQVGMSVRPEFMNSVTLLPNTGIREYRLSASDGGPDVVILSCVIHHVPAMQRPRFFSDLRDLLGDRKAIIVVVEVEPGYCKSFLGYCSDKYITGDKRVEPVSRKEIIKLVKDHLPHARYSETGLFAVHKPNYCLIFFVNEERAS